MKNLGDVFLQRKETGLKALLRACGTTIGKKFIMAVTGLLLCAFLVVHLAGNLLLYVGPQAYNEYAHALHEQEWLVQTAEVGLIVLFGLHIVLAFQTTKENRAARRQRYFVKESKIDNRLSPFKPETWMLISGLIVLAFLILHLIDFTFLLRWDIDYASYADNEYAKAAAILRTPLTALVYTAGSAVLGIHLAHGVSSTFQTLGWNHPKYEALIRWFGVIFAVVIGLGFVTFPVFFFLWSG